MNKILATALVVLAFSGTASANSVTVAVVLNPMGDFNLTTNDIKGSAKMEGDTLVAKDVVVNLKKLKSGVELRDKHTQKHLETAKFPDAVLSIGKGKGGKGQGKLKIRGIEKLVKGTYKVEGNQVSAKFNIKLSDFDIKDINYMGVGVEDEVTIQVKIPLAG